MAAATGFDDEDICPLCLDVFTLPKFLPCHHTFCQHCIDDLAQGHPNRPFPCPSCRKATTLPPGGAASLQSNYYIKTPHQQQASGAGTGTVGSTSATKTQDVCDTHPDKKLEFYCTECDQAICINCKLTKHELHKTEDLTAGLALKKKQLHSDRERLLKAVEDVETKAKVIQYEKDALGEDKAAVEKSLRERHAAVVASAGKRLKAELDSLEAMYADMFKVVVDDAKQKRINSSKLSALLRQVEDAIQSGSTKVVFSVVEAMNKGQGSRTSIEELTLQKERPSRMPALHASGGIDIVQTVGDYMGSVKAMAMKVTKRFRCSDDPNTEVFSLCHIDSDLPSLCVSYVRLGTNENAPDQLFSESGERRFSRIVRQGKVSYKQCEKGKWMTTEIHPDVFTTYSKSPKAPYFRLANFLNADEAAVNRVTVTSVDPFKSKSETECRINVDFHRAFDVDESERYFAVVQEPKSERTSRQVHLYQRMLSGPVSTYEPPLEDYNPSDVLFFKLGSREVLLVADQLNSRIHAVTFKDGQLEFDCVLCHLPGQPTALAVDVQGRVWVACKGGDILTIEAMGNV